MNKEIEEFDKKQLEELLKRLKDINNFTGFKDGAFKYYLGKYEADLLLSYIEQLEECYCNRTDCIGRIKDSKKYDSLLQKYKQLQNNRDKAINEVQYIIDYGFDYDGFNSVESLKGLIDMLVDYARSTKKILKGDSDE